jgi:hypothetical protein
LEVELFIFVKELLMLLGETSLQVIILERRVLRGRGARSGTPCRPPT